MSEIIELSPGALASPANAFFAVGDHQNFRLETSPHPLTSRDLRNELHFYLLFCDRLSLVAEDLILNERLTGLLLRPEYCVLLEEGVFVPLLRSHYDSFPEVLRYLRKPDLYNPVPQGVWLPLLAELEKQKMYIG